MLFLLSCASTTYIKTSPEGAKVKDGTVLKGVTPYFHWDRGISYTGKTFTLEMEGYKDKTIKIKKSKFVYHRIIFLPILSWPWLFEYPEEYFFELEKSEQIIQGAESEFPKQAEITKPNIPDSSETAEKLRRLNKLNDAGLFTKQEYEERRKAIVGGM
jgi:hypothetical protein